MDLDLVLETAKAVGPAVVIVAVGARSFCVLVRHGAGLVAVKIRSAAAVETVKIRAETELAEAKIRSDAETKQLEMILRARSDELRMIVSATEASRLPEAIAAFAVVELDAPPPALTGTDGRGLEVESHRPPSGGLRSVPPSNESNQRRRRGRGSRLRGKRRDGPPDS
jgi:hypothetical protein